MAQWDFRKAQEIQKKKHAEPRGILRVLGNNTSSNYIQDLMSISGEFAKYMPVSALVRKNGENLFFGNGVRVDLSTKDALIVLPSKKAQGKPLSLFYLDQGKLIEKVYPEARMNTSVLYFEDAGSFYCVTADARLMRSLLFRLYYLKGQGLNFFKPVIEKGSLSGGTIVRIFELDREKLFS